MRTSRKKSAQPQNVFFVGAKSVSNRKCGFTLVEILVSVTILLIILLISSSIVGFVQKAWKTTTSRASAFQASRAAFESMTKRINQAELNTYFDYADTNGKTPEQSGYLSPDHYARQSQLHFVIGQANTLVPGVAGTQTPTHAIFFQAPMGFTSVPSTGDAQLANLLNAIGYYVEYSDDAGFRPSFLTGVVPLKNRYRLMQVVQSTDQLRIYDTPLTSANRFKWFQDMLALPAVSPARPLADNVIAAIFWPMLGPNSSGGPLTTDYGYDTKRYLTNPATADVTRNQLPPIVQLTLVAIDEPSAIRLEKLYPNGTAPLLQAGALFTAASDPYAAPPSQFDKDMGKLTQFLIAQKLGYRIFTIKVPLRQSKFNAN